MAIDFLKQKNYAFSTLNDSINSISSSLVVVSGHGVRFPSTGSFMAVLWDWSLAAPSLDNNRELVKATLISGDSFSIIRAQEGTSAANWGAGSNIALVFTAGTLDEIEDAIVDGTKSFATATGINTYTASLPHALKAYSDGVCVRVRFVNANTGATTLNINALGARKIYRPTSAGYQQFDEPDTITANMLTTLVFNSALDDGAGGWILYDAGYVSISKNESIYGRKTFGTFPLTPQQAPIQNYEVANRKFVTDSIGQISIPNPIPSGTSMLFNQASAPTGWTKKTNWSDTASVIVGNTYDSGGSHNPVSYTTGISVADHDAHAHYVAGHQHAYTTVIAHKHNLIGTLDRADLSIPTDRMLALTADNIYKTSPTSSNYKVMHGDSISSTGDSTGYTGWSDQNTSDSNLSSHSVTQSTYTPRYVTVIAATKD
jgi:hypothetical protein